MARAGDYWQRFEWLQRVPGGGGKSAVGERTDTYPSQGYLHGYVSDVDGGRSGAKESERQVMTGTILLRNYPAVAAGDRLRDTQYGIVWTIDSAVGLDNETRCEVRSPRWTAGGGTAG